MKKLIIWAALLCLLLTACTQQNTPTGSVTTVPSDPWISDHDFLALEDMDSYKKFIQAADLPDNFVYYESLTALGEFNGLLILSPKTDDYEALEYSEYVYLFQDANGYELTLWVGSERTEKAPVASEYQGDMRVISTTGEALTGSVFRNGVEYRYHGGKLSYISWESNGIPFTLGTDTKAEGFYPKDGPLTFVQELLHTDTNKAAMESFKTALEKPAVK